MVAVARVVLTFTEVFDGGPVDVDVVDGDGVRRYGSPEVLLTVGRWRRDLWATGRRRCAASHAVWVPLLMAALCAGIGCPSPGSAPLCCEEPA